MAGSVDAADFGRWIDEPAVRRRVRDRDQLGAQIDRALERDEVDPPGRVVDDHFDLDPHARLHPSWVEKPGSSGGRDTSGVSPAPKPRCFKNSGSIALYGIFGPTVIQFTQPVPASPPFYPRRQNPQGCRDR
jgi:hypothetical protein